MGRNEQIQSSLRGRDNLEFDLFALILKQKEHPLVSKNAKMEEICVKVVFIGRGRTEAFYIWNDFIFHLVIISCCAEFYKLK